MKEKVKPFLAYCEAQPDFHKLLENKSPFEIWEYFKVKVLFTNKFQISRQQKKKTLIIL